LSQGQAIVQYDAVVVGGGPAGCAAAIGLVRAGASVLLLERSQSPADKPGEVIDASIRSSLAALGVEGCLVELGSLTLAGRLVEWGDVSGADVADLLNPLGPGSLVRRSDFERGLLGAARTLGVTVVTGTHSVVAAPVGTAWQIGYGNGGAQNCAATPLIVEATGRGPGVVGSGRRRRLDNLVALMAYVPAQPNVHDQRLIVEAAEDGWWYGALLPNRQVVVALMTDARSLPRGVSARRAWWTARLCATRHIRGLVPAEENRFVLRGFPADSSIRETLSGPGWVALGEAAAAYDPLTGCGVALAVTKGAALVRLVANFDFSDAIAAYVAAERDTFAGYAAERALVYSQAAHRFTTQFWAGFG
jgi:flavin-dependent dehydrogenase